MMGQVTAFAWCSADLCRSYHPAVLTPASEGQQRWPNLRITQPKGCGTVAAFGCRTATVRGSSVAVVARNGGNYAAPPSAWHAARCTATTGSPPTPSQPSKRV